MNRPHPVSFVIHTGVLSELGLQPSDLLLELISLVFTLHSLLLYTRTDYVKDCVHYIKHQHETLSAML